MQSEIEIARLVQNFVRDCHSIEEQDKLITLLDEDPGLLDYIMIEYMVYEYSLKRNNISHGDTKTKE